MQGGGALEIAFYFRRRKVRGQLCQPGIALHDVAAGGLVGGCDLLCHVCQAQVVHAFYVADIGLQLPQQHGKQAGLAAAIGPDQRQLLAGLQGYIGAFQQQLATPAQFDIA